MTIKISKQHNNSFLEYYSGSAEEVCNHEKDIIRTEKECTAALKQLGYQFKGEYWKKSARNIPSGCSIRTLNNKAYMNTNSGLGRGRRDQIPICKGKVNQGNSLEFFFDSATFPTISSCSFEITKKRSPDILMGST